MKTISLLHVEKPCSQLIMGSADFLVPANIEKASVMLDKFVEAGGTVFDTAHQYKGSEAALGLWLSRRKNRDKVVILTKGAHHNDGSPGPRVTPEAITKDLTESLERLQTPYVDLYALHRDDPVVAVGPIVDELNKHLAAGKIRAIGVSNWTKDRIQAANNYAAERGLRGFTFSSTNLSLAVPNEPRWPGCVAADTATREWHLRNRIPLLAWSAQAGGFFSGRFTPEDRSNAEMVRVFYNDGNWERLRRAQWLAHEKGLSALQIALAFVLNQPFPTGAIIGPETPEELQSSLTAVDLSLTPHEVKWLDLQTDSQKPRP